MQSFDWVKLLLILLINKRLVLGRRSFSFPGKCKKPHLFQLNKSAESRSIFWLLMPGSTMGAGKCNNSQEKLSDRRIRNTRQV